MFVERWAGGVLEGRSEVDQEGEVDRGEDPLFAQRVLDLFQPDDLLKMVVMRAAVECDIRDRMLIPETVRNDTAKPLSWFPATNLGLFEDLERAKLRSLGILHQHDTAERPSAKRPPGLIVVQFAVVLGTRTKTTTLKRKRRGKVGEKWECHRPFRTRTRFW